MHQLPTRFRDSKELRGACAAASSRRHRVRKIIPQQPIACLGVEHRLRLGLSQERTQCGNDGVRNRGLDLGWVWSHLFIVSFANHDIKLSF